MAPKQAQNIFSPKTLLTYLSPHCLCSSHQVSTHSEHKRPRNYQKKRFVPADCSEFWIFRGNFRANIQLKNTQISKFTLTYLNKPHLWSNHQVSTQSPHKWPRKYQKTVFCLEMTEFCNFSRNFGPNFLTKNFPNFQNYSNVTQIHPICGLITKYQPITLINGRAITEKSPKNLFLPLLQGKSAKTPIQPFSIDSYESRKTVRPTCVQESSPPQRSYQVYNSFGEHEIYPGVRRRPKNRKKMETLHFLKKTKTKMGMQSHL